MIKQIMVGGVPVGGGALVTIQSMCNTPTHDVAATVDQIRRLEAAEGAHTRTVRLTGRKAQVAEDGKSCQFTFDVDLYYREEPQTTGEVMEYLKQEETWKRQ